MSLDELNNLPTDITGERLRMLRPDLFPTQAPPQSLIADATEPVKVAPMSPVTVTANAPATEATREAQPKLQPLTPQVSTDAVAPMKPPSYLESPQSSMMGFGSRETARRAGEDLSAPVSAGPTLPTTESGRQEVELARLRDENRHPWGTPENHPGFFGKLGHVLSRVGNIAGDVVAPATMELIPGTDLNRRVEEAERERRLGAAETRETAKEAVEQRPEIAEATGEARGRLQEEKDIAAEKREKDKEEAAQKREESREGSAETIAGGRTASAEKIAEGRTKSAEQIALERAQSAERIAVGHNLAMTEAARIRATAANDPDKLTNTMKTMKQQAQSTLPGIDRALDETEKVAAKLGPVEGRWNDFWQGKVGAADPDFAHYKDEIALVSSAVTLAHARGRMSNELFEHFQKMFDAGHQAPENMIQALNVAKEWLTEYAHMGEKPAAGGGGTAEKQVHNGFEYTKGEDGLWHKGKAVQPQ